MKSKNKNNSSWTKVIPFLTIFILSILPAIFTWGRFSIGGDIMIPFNSEGLEKYLYQWIDVQNGQYLLVNFVPLYLFYSLTDFIGLGVYHISIALLFLLNLVAGFGVLKLAKILHKNKNEWIYLIPIVFYLLSPALLNGWHYMYFYSFIPWFLYFCFKIIKNSKIEIADILGISLVIFFSSLDFPNPKYFFFLLVALTIIFVVAIALKTIKPRFFLENWLNILMLVGLSGYILLPLVIFATLYSSEDYGVKTMAGYKDEGRMMDFGSARIDKMFRLHHDGLNLIPIDREVYLNDWAVSFLGYSFIFLIIVGTFILRKKKGSFYRPDLILFFLTVVFLFFAIGPNAPTGFLYRHLVINFSLFAFLRTTAGAVLFISCLYAMLLFLFIVKIEKKKLQILVSILILVFLLAVGRPMVTGEYYRNITVDNVYTDKYARGHKIPDDYFLIKNEVEKTKIDSRVLYPNLNFSYMNTKWGYFGPMIYNFLYDSRNIGYEKISLRSEFHNVGFVFMDNHIINSKDRVGIEKMKSIEKKGSIELKRLPRSTFLPHFYVPNNVYKINYRSDGLTEAIHNDQFEIRSALFFTDQNDNKREELDKIDESFHGEQTLEFKKINSTKYRVKVHQAKNIFPLIFSETFHQEWKAYVIKRGKNNKVGKYDLKDYRILDGNEVDQATTEELRGFIGNGWISDLGSGKKKTLNHKKWNIGKQKEELDYKEQYSVDFISKNFQGTIQNNNLPNGNFFETWFKEPLEEENHLVANDYANSWLINPEKICKEKGICSKNDDQTYDFELIIEFKPQRFFYWGVITSALSVAGCLAIILLNYFKKTCQEK